MTLNSRLSDVKKKYADDRCLDPDKIELIYKGKVVSDGSSLKEIGLRLDQDNLMTMIHKLGCTHCSTAVDINGAKVRENLKKPAKAQLNIYK